MAFLLGAGKAVSILAQEDEDALDNNFPTQSTKEASRSSNPSRLGELLLGNIDLTDLKAVQSHSARLDFSHWPSHADTVRELIIRTNQCWLSLHLSQGPLPFGKPTAFLRFLRPEPAAHDAPWASTWPIVAAAAATLGTRSKHDGVEVVGVQQSSLSATAGPYAQAGVRQHAGRASSQPKSGGSEKSGAHQRRGRQKEQHAGHKSKKHKSKHQRDDDDDKDDDEPGSQKRSTGGANNRSRKRADEKKFPCPFHARYGDRYPKCKDFKWPENEAWRLKDHLERQHRLWVCHDCNRSFGDCGKRDEHRRTSPDHRNVVNPQRDYGAGLDPEQSRHLKDKKKVWGKQGQEYLDIVDGILFPPSEPLPDHKNFTWAQLYKFRQGVLAWRQKAQQYEWMQKWIENDGIPLLNELVNGCTGNLPSMDQFNLDVRSAHGGLEHGSSSPFNADSTPADGINVPPFQIQEQWPQRHVSSNYFQPDDVGYSLPQQTPQTTPQTATSSSAHLPSSSSICPSRWNHGQDDSAVTSPLFAEDLAPIDPDELDKKDDLSG